MYADERRRLAADAVVKRRQGQTGNMGGIEDRRAFQKDQHVYGDERRRPAADAAIKRRQGLAGKMGGIEDRRALQEDQHHPALLRHETVLQAPAGRGASQGQGRRDGGPKHPQEMR